MSKKNLIEMRKISKKKREICEYCGGEFIYLSRHKCKVKQRIESEDEETEQDRRQTRLEFLRKELSRKLKKDETVILEIIRQEGELFLEELKEKGNISSNKIERILETLELKSKIKVQRELDTANWTKRISYIEDLREETAKESKKIDTRKDNFVWEMVWRVPCFLCPFIEICDNTQVRFNPMFCSWLTDWIWHCLDNKTYQNPFEGIDINIKEK